MYTERFDSRATVSKYVTPGKVVLVFKPDNAVKSKPERGRCEITRCVDSETICTEWRGQLIFCVIGGGAR